MSLVTDIGVSLGTAALLAPIPWVGERALRLRRSRRDAAWFGSAPGDEWLVPLPRFYGDERAVSLTLVRAFGELLRLADSIGCVVEAMPNDTEVREFGAVTEVSVGGAGEAGSRPATHIKTWIEDFEFRPRNPGNPESLAVKAGVETFLYVPGVEEFALLAKVVPGAGRRPLFIIAGQTAAADHGAAWYLRKNHRELKRRYGPESFGLLLKVEEPKIYGPAHTSEVAEVGVRPSTV